MKTLVERGIWVAPLVAVAIAIWAEFADLTPPLLLAVAVPAMIVTLWSAAIKFALTPRPLALVVAGTAVGLATFTIAEGLYLAIHYSAGGTLDFDSFDSQPAMAAALFGIHVAVGTLTGFGLGVAAAVVALLLRLRGKAPSELTAPSGVES